MGDYLAPFWEWEFCSLHGPPWWHRHWAKTGRRAEAARKECAMLEADQGRHFGSTRLAAAAHRRP